MSTEKKNKIVKIGDIVERICKISGMDRKLVAPQIFEMNENALNMKISRGTFKHTDIDNIARWASNENIDLNWLLLGSGEPKLVVGNKTVTTDLDAEWLKGLVDDLRIEIKEHRATIERLEAKLKANPRAGREARGDSKEVPHYDGPERRKGQRRIKDDPDAIPGKKDRRSGLDRRVAVLQS